MFIPVVTHLPERHSLTTQPRIITLASSLTHHPFMSFITGTFIKYYAAYSACAISCLLNARIPSTCCGLSPRCGLSPLRTKGGTSLGMQGLRIRLPMQGTQVRALVWEDPTCHRATKPVRHNFWACALEPVSHNYWAYEPQLRKPACLEPVICNKRSHDNEKPTHCNEE